MDEDPAGPPCSCGSDMDDCRVCVCLARSLCRRQPAPRSAFVSYVVVVLGFAHTFHSLGGPAHPRLQQTCPTSSGAFLSEPAGDLSVRLCLGGGPRRIGDWSMERLGWYSGSCRFTAGPVSLELAHLLADSGGLASISLLQPLHCR